MASKRRDRGFSLIELLIVLAIMGVVLAGYGTMMGNMNKSAQGAYQKVMYTDALSQLFDLARGGCKSIGLDVAGGYKVPDAATISALNAGTLDPASVTDPSARKTVSALAFPVPLASTGLSVDTYQIKKITATADPLVYSAELDLSVSRPGSYGGPFKAEKVNLSLTVDNATSRNITACTASAAGGGATGKSAYACGPGDFYDSGWVDTGTVASYAQITLTHNIGTTDTEVYLEHKGGTDFTIPQPSNPTIKAGMINRYAADYVYWYNKTATAITVYRYGQVDAARYLRVVVRKTDCSK